MSKAIPQWKVVINLKPSRDELSAIDHVKGWYSYGDDNPNSPPIPDIHLCGPIKKMSSLEFAVCKEEEAHSLVSHIEKSGFVESHVVIRL